MDLPRAPRARDARAVMRGFAVGGLLVSALAGCGEGGAALTLEEALFALEEAALSGQAEMSSAGAVELATGFTIGAALEAAAEEVSEFIESRLPCAGITVEGAKLTVEYGEFPGECSYHGRTYYGGLHHIVIVSTAAGGMLVRHEWNDLVDGRVSVSGSAEASWSAAGGIREVNYDLDWTRYADGFAATGRGQRSHAAHPDGQAVGLRAEGHRSWTSARGRWHLENDGEMLRWTDPVPEQGTYRLTTPFSGPAGALKTATMTFERVDENRIRVTLESGDEEFAFDVNRLGAVTDSDTFAEEPRGWDGGKRPLFAVSPYSSAHGGLGYLGRPGKMWLRGPWTP